MENEIDRREFLQRGMLAGAGILADAMLPGVLRADRIYNQPAIRLCAVAGDKVFDNTMAAVEALGGMKKFVKEGSSVALLINSVFDRQGASVNPEIALAVVKMCLEAGANRIVTVERTPDWFWGR